MVKERFFKFASCTLQKVLHIPERGAVLQRRGISLVFQQHLRVKAQQHFHLFSIMKNKNKKKTKKSVLEFGRSPYIAKRQPYPTTPQLTPAIMLLSLIHTER